MVDLVVETYVLNLVMQVERVFSGRQQAKLMVAHEPDAIVAI
ncbi:hypothetical protein [Parvibaculum sp.]|jgi:hypothetical protein|nr:hypothetical protein [Parvibaculum sp.]|tara:strand:+ start:346 stop:471 length:126 start_codon:yes stop_codon:yes gene_type:complete